MLSEQVLLGSIRWQRQNKDNESEKQKDKFNNPIESGEIFDPELELQNLLQRTSGDRKKRKAEIKIYKERLAFQKRGLRDLQITLIEKIRENPDIEEDELHKIILEFTELYGFSDKQSRKAQTVLHKYLEKHKTINKIFEHLDIKPDNIFKNSKSIGRVDGADAKKIYEYVFQHSAKGDVEVIIGPMTLFFRCTDITDYATIRFQGKLIKEKVTARDFSDEELKIANISQGVFIKASRIEGLKGAIIAEKKLSKNNFVENKKSQEMYIHEEQHAIKGLFFEVEMQRDEFLNELNIIQKEIEIKKQSGANQKQIEGLLKEAKDIEEKYIRNLKKLLNSYAKDEILAYFKAGNHSRESIASRLLMKKEEGGIYDYFEMYESRFGKDDLEAFAKLGETEISGFYSRKDYASNIMDATGAYIALRRIAGYSGEEAIATLAIEPLNQWHIVVKRIIDERLGNYEKSLNDAGASAQDRRFAKVQIEYINNALALYKKMRRLEDEIFIATEDKRAVETKYKTDIENIKVFTPKERQEALKKIRLYKPILEIEKRIKQQRKQLEGLSNEIKDIFLKIK